MLRKENLCCASGNDRLASCGRWLPGRDKEPHYMATSSRPDSPEVADYLGVLRRRWAMVVLLTVAGAVLALGYAQFAPRQYAAAVLIQVNPLPNNANAVAGRTSGTVDMDNEAQIAQSVLVATAAAQQMHSSELPTDLL